jgi:hypothetical protein
MTFGTSFRHFKALSKKNAINWKRTPLGSCTEIFCPVILMIIMTRIRLLVTPELSAEYKLASLRHPMFQPAKPDAVTGLFDISAQSVIENAQDLNDFMFYTNYTNTKASVTSKASSYIPVVDPYGPYLFYPSQCQSNEGLIAAGRKYRAPVIAYIKQGNQIEEDIVDQLQAIFEMQAEIGSLVSMLP